MSEFHYRKPEKLNSLSIVLPAYNEASVIEEVVNKSVAIAQKITSEYEVIVMNDGSRDDTAKIVLSLAHTDPSHVRLLNNIQNMGYGPTVRKGIMASRKEWVFFTDADGQFDLSELTKLVIYTDDYDFVVGRRKKRSDPIRRKINAGIFNIAVRIFFGIKVKDVDCAYKLMRRDKLQSLNLVSQSAMINTEILYKANRRKLRIKEVNVTHFPRRHGQSTGANKDVIMKAVKEFYDLRYSFLRQPRALLRFNSHIVFWLATLSGIAATIWSYKHGVILAFGDAEAHINIAKRVVSGLTPGLGQLGGVWLPLPHLLMAPLTAINFLWRTGLAGSIISVAAFIWLCLMIYRLAYELTSNFLASYLAPLVLILNPNMLYLSSTPMTETLLLSMVASTVYYFTRWLKYGRTSSFIAMSFFAMAATLSRYDGWPVAVLELVFIAIIVLRRTHSRKAAEGLSLAFAYVGFAGIAAWFLWNQLIFGTPMYFANSVYGSKQQQMFFLAKGYLPTYHNLALSFIYFAEDMRLVVGLPILLACLGLVYFTYKCLRKRQYAWLAIAALTLTPILFYVTSLYIGQASLILPEFAKAGAQYTISNVRYGIQILLAVGLFVAYLGARFRKIIPLLLLALVVQGVFFIKTNNVITYVDATRGLSSQAVSKGPDAPAAEAYMRSHYNGGLVLMDDYRNPIGIIESGVPMNEFIGSGNKPYWQESLDNPAKLASWVIVQKASTDYVWTHMKNKQILYDHFALVFQSGNIYIYHRRTTNPAFVEQAGQSLELQGIPFMLKGINSYDLLTQSDSVIKTTLSNTASSGFNTLRLWCFNKQGTMTAADFHNLDYILSEAHTYNIKLICTLGNALNNYGGIADFGASNAMQFFSSPQIIKNYEAYVTSVVSHISSITHKPYSQDSAIVAWELINEPRIEGDSNSQVLSSWIERVGEVLLSSDPNHLISPGTEGFMANAAQPEYDVGSHGSDIDTICSQEVVSLCSAHLYPKYLDGEQPTTTDIDTIIQQWRALGDQINKPLFLGEVGYDLSAVGSSQAQELLFMQSVATAVRDYKLNGALIWNIGDKSDNNFTLQYGNPNSTQVLGVWSNDL